MEVDTWVSAAGKNGMRRDWHVRDSQSGQTITRATRSEMQRILILIFAGKGFKF